MNVKFDITAETEAVVFAIRNDCNSSIDPRGTVLFVVSEVESQVDKLIRGKIYSLGLGHSSVSDYFINNHLPEYFGTWSKRKSLLKGLFNFDGYSCAVGQEFDSLVDIRNSLMHGGGSLTELQRKNFRNSLKMKRKLESKFSVRFSGNRMVLEGSASRVAGEVSVRFLIAVDEAIAATG